VQGGWPSYHPFYGACIPYRARRRVSHLSFWCTARRQSYLRTSTMAAHKYEPTPRKATRLRLRIRSTSLMKRKMWRCYIAPSTNKLCDAIMSATCVLASSTLETWSFDESKAARTDTSSRHLGRGHSSSTRCSNQERTRSNKKTGGSSPTHGTSNAYARFTLE
jgi:hypothetical protein